jgi:enoyl-CoA hydratase/carnithine racemase
VADPADPVRLAVEGSIATVTLARPVKLNALNRSMLARLEALAAELDARDAVRVVVLSGDGPKAFCAGADIDEWSALDPLAFGRAWVAEGHRIFDRWARLRPPVIAALNGLALGGGLELAATADLRIAEAHARLGLPETRIGVLPGWSGTQRLVRRCGPQAVRRLALTGELVDADEALRLGLVDEVCATGEGLSRARALAGTIAERSPVGVQLAKQLILAAEGEERLGATLEALAGTVAAGSHDLREGIAAFREKRAARFVGS